MTHMRLERGEKPKREGIGKAKTQKPKKKKESGQDVGFLDEDHVAQRQDESQDLKPYTVSQAKPYTRYRQCNHVLYAPVYV